MKDTALETAEDIELEKTLNAEKEEHSTDCKESLHDDGLSLNLADIADEESQKQFNDALLESKTFAQLALNLSLVGCKLAYDDEGKMSPDIVELLARKAKYNSSPIMLFVQSTKKHRNHACCILEDLAYNVDLSKYFSTDGILSIVDVLQRLYVFAWNEKSSKSKAAAMFKLDEKADANIYCTKLRLLWPTLIKRMSISFK